MYVEIERKFLVSSDAWRALGGRQVKMVQSYIVAPEGTLRVRIADKEAFLTLVGPPDGASRDVFEYPVPVEHAQGMLGKIFLGPRIEKTRHHVMHEGHEWHIDEFHGNNAGLVLAELELKSLDEPFVMPDWIAQEVTGNPAYSNAVLATTPALAEAS